MRHSHVLPFQGMKARIELRSSPFKISHPACDAIEREFGLSILRNKRYPKLRLINSISTTNFEGFLKLFGSFFFSKRHSRKARERLFVLQTCYQYANANERVTRNTHPCYEYLQEQ